jgi:D-citramalate synthase
LKHLRVIASPVPEVGDTTFLHKQREFMLMGTIKKLYFNDFPSVLKNNTRWQNFRQPILKNLQELGLKLNQEDLKLVTRIIELVDKRKPLLKKTFLILYLMFYSQIFEK